LPLAQFKKGWWAVADLSINFAGIRSPNPFWLASAPPTNSGAQIHRAFEAGWGGAVWKTIGAPVLNVSNRYGAWHYGGQKMLAINNVELISDRPIEINLREIAQVKRAWPDRALIVSAMVESKPETWHDVIRRIQDTGADGIELNYGCPHGMSERGMGSAVGQVPEYCEQITRWVMEVAKIPVIVKLTPNISDIVMPARAAVAAGANALSLINTINSIIGVNLDTLEITPNIGGKGGHGGYAGPAVKPIALNMLSALGRDDTVSASHLPISGMGGISDWRDAAEFLLLGASSLQVCTAVMHYGFRIIEDLCDGLSNWMDEKGFATIPEVVGGSLQRVSDFNNLDLSFRAVARINQEKCIRCNLCYVACDDTAHQCIDLIAKNGSVVQPHSYDIRSNGREQAVETRPSVHVRENDCVGCRLCFNVCPVEGCIEMIEEPSVREHVTWEQITRTQPEVTEDWDQMQRYRQKMGIEIH
jgi:dihydropyrimidine dehydrogenase (NAD+) subunit PreA